MLENQILKRIRDDWSVNTARVLQAENQLPYFRAMQSTNSTRVDIDGRARLMLGSNNYLGLADHPRVREAAAEAAMRWGVGAGASRLVSGTMTIHRRLEERLAAFKGSESCILFGSGYLANLGVIGALTGPGGTVFSDELKAGIVCSGMNGGSHEKTREMMELFAREVMPHFREDAHMDETAGVGR